MIPHFFSEETGPERGSHGPRGTQRRGRKWRGRKPGCQERQPRERGSPPMPGLRKKRRWNGEEETEAQREYRSSKVTH